MIITCEKCGISFNLDESLLKPSGSKVRCSKCKTVFTAYPPEPEIKSVLPRVDQGAASESDNDLDFSDLEQMLDSDDSLPDDPEKKDESGTKTTEVDDGIDEEIDISGLEDMLDSSDDLEVPSKDDLDLDLSIDSDEEKETEEAVSETKELDDLDLDISFDIDDDAEADMIEEDIAAEEDLDLSLESDEEGEEEIAGAADELEDLDLSLESDEAGEEETAAASDELEDLDLDLSLESDEEGEEAVAADEEGLEDLELELDGVEEEGALESDLLSTKTVSEVEDDSDDLNLELDIDEDAGEEDEEEIDLAELEQTLEMELLSPVDGDEDSGKEIENVELELSDDENITDDVDVDEELDIASDADVSDIEQMLEMDSDEEVKETPDEMELEFDIEGAGDKKAPVFESATDDDDVHTSLDLTAGKKKEKPKSRSDSGVKPVEKKKISTFLVLLIVFLLLIGAAVGGYFLLVSQGVKLPSLNELNIPYISDLLNPDAKKDLGMVETVQSMVKSEFVDNTTLGKLFVITGNVKNSTAKACHSVKVTAKLYATGKKLAKSKTVYAGSKMSKEELSTIDLETLNKNMANPLSSTGQPIRILPGGEIPFMIVIPNLPDNLEEYKVMVTDSVME
jgi:predicted Zn finger-like uncharacterized protein